MHSFDSLARSMTDPAPRTARRRHQAPNLLASAIALTCAVVPLVTMVQVYLSAI